MSAGLLPDQPAKIDHLPVEAMDPLYGPVRMGVLGHPDTRILRVRPFSAGWATIRRRSSEPNRAAYLRLQQVLFAGRPVAPGELPPLTECGGDLEPRAKAPTWLL